MPVLEIACFSTDAAFAAEAAGADRVELCEDYATGGVTPSEETIRAVCQKLQIPVFIMIRPRSGNFTYTAAEFETMKQQVAFCKAQGCDGLVFGLLTPDLQIDEARCKELVELAAPLPCTFHRAFDEVADAEPAIEQLIRLGFRRILTSGGKADAISGKDNLRHYIHVAASRITILPGGGIRSANITGLHATAHATEYHSAALLPGTVLPDAEEIQRMKQEIIDL
jgi:copper homeostasis protein